MILLLDHDDRDFAADPDKRKSMTGYLFSLNGGAEVLDRHLAAPAPKSRCKECGGGSICQHQSRRSTCKECIDEADKSMPAGLEELAGAAPAAGKDL